MFRDLQVVLEPPLHGFYTYQDVVLGKVIFESPREEKVGWVHVFFHGWVNVEVIKTNNSSANSSGLASKYKDKEVLFQSHQKVYEGHEKLLKKVRYEWPFKFAFQAEKGDAASLPTSGKYTYSSVEYKIIAVLGHIGQTEDHIMSMMNPEDPRFLKESPISPTSIFLKFGQKTGAVAEQQLQFIQIRPEAAIDSYMEGPFSWDIEIASHHLPELEQISAHPPQKHGLFQREEQIPFSIDLQIPQSIIEGVPFTLVLSVSSRSALWNHKPPLVTLTSFKIQSCIIDAARIGDHHRDDMKIYPIWEGKRLNVPLGSKAVNIGQIYSFTLAGDAIVPSFNTCLLQRKYDFPTELTVEVGGKSFKALYSITSCVNVLSRNVATGGSLTQRQAPKQEPVMFKLQYSHIGRLIQEGDSPLREDSVMEAAIALSRTLTVAGIQHCFPGGSLIKLLPYTPNGRHVDNTSWDPESDSQKINRLFELHTGPFRTLPIYPHFDVSKLYLGFSDHLHGENITIYFPEISIQTDADQEKFANDTQGHTDAVKLDPVSLFNYRLWCLATHEMFGEPEIRDITPLHQAFGYELRQNRKSIDAENARIAVERFPTLGSVLVDLGVDVAPKRGIRTQPGEKEACPPYEKGVAGGYEQELVQGLGNKLQLEEKEAVPNYEQGHKKHHFWDSKH